MIRISFAILLGVAACGARSQAQPVHADDPRLAYGGLNENIRVGNLTVRPLAVAQDSRCPADVTCVWSGQLVLRLRVSGMRGLQTVSTIRPLALPGGRRLELASVSPARLRHPNGPRPAFRFGFRRR